MRDLRVAFRPRPAPCAVRGVDFDLHAGRTLGIVGESGSGKTVTSLAVMGLLRAAAVTGSITLDGRELLGLGDRRMSAIRGRDLAMVFQDPLVADADLQHRTPDRRGAGGPRADGEAQARARAVELLDLVGIPNARRGSTPSRTSSPEECASAW